MKGASRLPCCVAIACIVWFLFADLVVLSLIESAYQGESFAILNDLLEGSKVHAIEKYQDEWNDMSISAH